MLSQIGDTIRGFFEQRTRKREADRICDDVVDSPAKRTREDNSTKNHTPWYMQVQFSKMAEWIVTRKDTFADNYYYKQIMKSPKEAKKRVVVNSGQDGLNKSSEVEERDTNTSSSSGNYSWSGRHCQATPLNRYSHGYSFSKTQTDMPNSFRFNQPTEDAAFKSFKAPQPPIHKMRSPNSTHQSTLQGAEPPSYRGSAASVRSKSSTGRYRSMYDKTFRNDPNKRRNVWNRSKLATKESFRLEEKTRYAELLQKFTSTPVAGSLFGSCFPGLSEKSRQKSENESFFGLPMESTRLPEKNMSSVTISQPTIVKDVERSIFTPSASITDRSFRYLQAKRTAGKDVQPASYRFDSPEIPRQALSFEKMTPKVAFTPEAVSTPESESDVIILSEEQLPSVVRTPKSEEFIKSLKESKYMNDEWLHDLKNSYCSQARSRDRKIKEEEVKVHYFKEKREEFEDSLEKRLRERLALAEREPPALVENLEEEKEEDEFPQLTDEQEALIDSSLVPYPSNQVLSEGFRLQIMRKDMATLAGLNWLNDEIINFYMNMLMERGHQDNYSEVHAFNTFFYPKIMSSGHAGVKRWTRKIDIFSVDFILIPIHLGMHWCLAVIDFLKKEIRYYDSMGGKNPACLNALKNYLEEESLDKKKTSYNTSDWKLITVKDIPHQMNGSDCGMFTCKFAEYVTRKAPITFTQEFMPYFRRRMVYEILTKQLL